MFGVEDTAKRTFHGGLTYEELQILSVAVLYDIPIESVLDLIQSKRFKFTGLRKVKDFSDREFDNRVAKLQKWLNGTEVK